MTNEKNDADLWDAYVAHVHRPGRPMMLRDLLECVPLPSGPEPLDERNDADRGEERPLLFVHGQAEGGRLMTAGEVARLTDVSARTLQHYDDIGLLCPRRSGEGVANNRKLYDEGDIDRLGRIIALKEYGLTLSEIKAVIDADDAVILAVLNEKLAALRRQETKLRDLILFARMLSITGSNLVDGLVAGPAIVDDLADAARALPPYEHGRRWADELETPEEREVAFLALGKIVEDFASAGALAGFAAFERLVGFCLLYTSDAADE